VAALLQEYAVDLTPAKLEAVLETTARDVEGAPASTGDDLVTGAGLIDARAALDEFPAADAGPDQTVAAGSNVTLAAPVPRTTRPSRPSPGRRSPDHP
ncbi:MAG: hypothetical protein L0H63_01560, partial [Nitrococcus sp.]|nr:hypothetical protein [Nitrococcus sp.]